MRREFVRLQHKRLVSLLQHLLQQAPFQVLKTFVSTTQLLHLPLLKLVDRGLVPIMQSQLSTALQELFLRKQQEQQR